MSHTNTSYDTLQSFDSDPAVDYESRPIKVDRSTFGNTVGGVIPLQLSLSDILSREYMSKVIVSTALMSDGAIYPHSYGYSFLHEMYVRDPNLFMGNPLLLRLYNGAPVVLGTGLWYQKMPVFFLAPGSRYQESIPTEIFEDQINGLRMQAHGLNDMIATLAQELATTREELNSTNVELDAWRETLDICVRSAAGSYSSVPSVKSEVTSVIDAASANEKRGFKRPKCEDL
ncbi:unnamed protein product [Rhizoctonia solani]|uniref:Uncharacterized protein n=1 Tax=Rhizoctonia solani TaxID=456999 RepID=A0A8H2ZWD8_9AGAM|nr:unnamed protein product [Rhizoctonia solani]